MLAPATGRTTDEYCTCDRTGDALPLRQPYGVLEAHGLVLVFEAVISLIFFLDLFACFNTAYLEHERWVVSRSRIAGRYLRTWFWIDAPGSIVPLELIEVLTLLLSGSEQSSGIRIELLRIMRLVRLVRLLRLAKMTELFVVFQQQTSHLFAIVETATEFNVRCSSPRHRRPPVADTADYR